MSTTHTTLRMASFLSAAVAIFVVAAALFTSRIEATQGSPCGTTNPSPPGGDCSNWICLDAACSSDDPFCGSDNGCRTESNPKCNGIEPYSPKYKYQCNSCTQENTKEFVALFYETITLGTAGTGTLGYAAKVTVDPEFTNLIPFCSDHGCPCSGDSFLASLEVEIGVYVAGTCNRWDTKSKLWEVEVFADDANCTDRVEGTTDPSSEPLTASLNSPSCECSEPDNHTITVLVEATFGFYNEHCTGENLTLRFTDEPAIEVELTDLKAKCNT